MRRLLLLVGALAAFVCGRASELVSFAAESGGFPLIERSVAAKIVFDGDKGGVLETAVGLFADDVELVGGTRPEILDTQEAVNEGVCVVVGVLARSRALAKLERAGSIDTASLKGKWESFRIQRYKTQSGAECLAVIGSDPRGAAYGLLTLSRAMGVSPWYWWADVAPQERESVYVTPKIYEEGEPSVRYRGIFINDEDWGLEPWARLNFESGENESQDIGPKSYAKVFELLLRLKGNYCWPAMHPSTKAFNFYPENKLVADKYGIVMGASHCEPLLRNNVDEWDHHKYGDWNFETNADVINKYWEERVAENGMFENVYTVGMRGIHDSDMPGGGTVEEKRDRLERVIESQRKLIAEHVNPVVENVPQIFCPYKEVLEIYRSGLELPDDVTIVWADDNHGYIRQLSNEEERKRSGGAGVYYHMSYWGRPADFLWLSSVSPTLIALEMGKARAYGADRLWVFNVGDIKPAERELSFAMDFAWNADRWNANNAGSYLYHWFQETFGLSPDAAGEMSQLFNHYYDLAQDGKPEHIDRVRYSKVEALRRIERYRAIRDEARRISTLHVPSRLRPAWLHLVTYPIEGALRMNEKQLLARMSRDEAISNPLEAALWAAEAKEAYGEIVALTAQYNLSSGGKWKHFMDYRPRKRPVFDMPPVLQQSLAKDSVEGFSDEPIRRLSAGVYLQKGDGANASCVGIGGLGDRLITTSPMTADPAKTTDESPWVEYLFQDLDRSEHRLVVKTLPAHSVYEKGQLRIAVSVNDSVPQIFDLEHPERTPEWDEMVLRGYASAELKFKTDSFGEAHVRVYLMDPGISLRELEIY